jgi:hypothetical protein
MDLCPAEGSVRPLARAFRPRFTCRGGRVPTYVCVLRGGGGGGGGGDATCVQSLLLLRMVASQKRRDEGFRIRRAGSEKEGTRGGMGEGEIHCVIRAELTLI